MGNQSRRRFIAASSAMVCAAHSFGAESKCKKALIHGLPTEASLAPLKEAGFDGIECNAWNASSADAEKARIAADKMGMKIHSVLRGWANMTEPDGVQQSIADTETALKTAQILGADAILLVPGKTQIKPIPQPWEFSIEFDKSSALVSKVVEGDNAPFADYIAIQNKATTCSRDALKRLAPVAEKNGVIIAVENVWNNFWVNPDLFAAYIRSCESPWIKAYLDLGNHVKYAPTEEWIRALDQLIVKCHVKDFKLSPNGQGGTFVNIREGSVNWPSVVKELNKVGYQGWMTIEGSGKLAMEERGQRLDRILSGN